MATPFRERLPAARGELERAQDPRPARQLRRRQGDSQVNLGLCDDAFTVLFLNIKCIPYFGVFFVSVYLFSVSVDYLYYHYSLFLV